MLSSRHQRPSTSESCTQGGEKRTRTSTNFEQSDASGADSDAEDISTSSSCNDDDDNLTQQQDDLFASLVVTLSSNDVANIVETLWKDNSRPCLRMMCGEVCKSIGKVTRLRFDSGIICDVNHIDNSVLQKLVKYCQRVKTNSAQDKPVICCINHDSKLLHFCSKDTGTSATRPLCTFGDCVFTTKEGRSFCSKHSLSRNRLTDVTNSTVHKPLLEQLAFELLRLALPQQKDVVDLLRRDCKEAVGVNHFGNIRINLDGIPKHVLELLRLKMDEFEAGSEKYRIGTLFGIQQPLEDEEGFMNMTLRCISLRKDWALLPIGKVSCTNINEEGVRTSNLKKSDRGDKKSDRGNGPTNHPPWNPSKCSMQFRIDHTTPISLRIHQTKMMKMNGAAKAALECISGIKDSTMRKSAEAAYRKRAGIGNNEPLTEDDIAKVLQDNVLKHKVIGSIDCPALELLYHALTQDKSKDLLKIVPTNELPPRVKNKYADKRETLGDFAVMIHAPNEFIEECMSQLWGHMDLNLFNSSFYYRDFKVSLQMKKNTKSPYICIISNTITGDPVSLIGSSSVEELNVELKSMKAKEKVHLQNKKKMMGEVVRLKARITELEGGLGVTEADVTVDTSSTDEEGKEVTEEQTRITPQNSYAAIVKRIPRKSNTREQAAAAALPPVQLFTNLGSYTSTVAEPAGTSLRSRGDGANTKIAGVQNQNRSLVPPRNMSGGNSSLRNSSRGEVGRGPVPGRVDYRPTNLAPSRRRGGGGGGRGGGREQGTSLRSGGGRGLSQRREENRPPNLAPSHGGRQRYAPSGEVGRGSALDRGDNRPPNLAPSLHGRVGEVGRGYGQGREDYRPPNSAPSRGGGGVFHSDGHTRGYGSSNNNASLYEHGHGRRIVGKIMKVLGKIGNQYGFINSEEILDSNGQQKDIYVQLEAKIFGHIRDKFSLRGSVVTFELRYDGPDKPRAIWPELIEE
mmetsp:Transcript_27490/g.42378  ORF Transcript_27490/g.42378 Transcript_27490/m.42378 type:complete len:964 (+) Transcript_27490:45-2936(+)